MPASAHEAFWNRLSRSGLVDAETFAALRHAHDATVPSADLENVPAIAQWLVRQGTLTRWQVRRLAADEPGPLFLGDYRLLDRRDRRGLPLRRFFLGQRARRHAHDQQQCQGHDDAQEFHGREFYNERPCSRSQRRAVWYSGQAPATSVQKARE